MYFLRCICGVRAEEDGCQTFFLPGLDAHLWARARFCITSPNALVSPSPQQELNWEGVPHLGNHTPQHAGCEPQDAPGGHYDGVKQRNRTLPPAAGASLPGKPAMRLARVG